MTVKHGKLDKRSQKVNGLLRPTVLIIIIKLFYDEIDRIKLENFF